MKEMKNKVLVLCSGGPDCVVAAAMLKHEGFDVTFLHFHYGQRAAPAEYEAVINCSTSMLIPFKRIDVAACFKSITSGLLFKGDEDSVPDGADLKGKAAYVPARNLILLSIAAGCAVTWDQSHIAIGNILSGAYPDNTIAFQDSFDKLLVNALPRDTIVRCLAPVNLFSKTQVIEMGHKLNVPFELTWSCFLGGGLHCGKCASCVGRKEAFETLGLKDPVSYLD